MPAPGFTRDRPEPTDNTTNRRTTRKTVAHPQHWARTAYGYFWLGLGYAYFGGLGLLLTLVAAVLYPLLPRQAGSHLGRRIIGAVFRSFLALMQAPGILRLDLSALDSLRGEPGLIIAPNHPCLLDAVFVISRIPGVACITKADNWNNPMLGGGARLAGYIRNDSARGMLRQAASELQAGHSLLVFPEGTRTRTPAGQLVQGRVRRCGQAGGRAGADRVHRDRQPVPEQGLAGVQAAAPADRLPGASGRSLQRGRRRSELPVRTGGLLPA